MTGFYRTGCCETGADDPGVHTICCVVDRAFLDASKALGNDLSTPMPDHGFPGLKPGDRWCVCAARWLQVQQGGAVHELIEAANRAGGKDNVSVLIVEGKQFAAAREASPGIAPPARNVFAGKTAMFAYGLVF